MKRIVLCFLTAMRAPPFPALAQINAGKFRALAVSTAQSKVVQDSGAKIE